jgi:hypothetical protein
MTFTIDEDKLGSDDPNASTKNEKTAYKIQAILATQNITILNMKKLDKQINSVKQQHMKMACVKDITINIC